MRMCVYFLNNYLDFIFGSNRKFYFPGKKNENFILINEIDVVEGHKFFLE